MGRFNHSCPVTALRLIPFVPLLVTTAIAVTGRAATTTRVIGLSGNRFTPAELTVHPGDTIRFVNGGNGGLHNVVFREDQLSPESRRLLEAALPYREAFRGMADAPLASPMLVLEGETFQFAMPSLPSGRYEYFCAPHFSAGMKGTLVVAP